MKRSCFIYDSGSDNRYTMHCKVYHIDIMELIEIKYNLKIYGVFNIKSVKMDDLGNIPKIDIEYFPDQKMSEYEGLLLTVTKYLAGRIDGNLFCEIMNENKIK